MALIPLADKSYKLEHNSRKMGQTVLVVDSTNFKKTNIEELF